MRPESIAFREDELAASSSEASQVSVRWLGTAAFEITAGAHTVLIDPYLTRASLARCALTRVASDRRVLRSHITRADAIVVGHTHFDHVLDVPSIAKMTGARVFGSRSAGALCRAEGVPEAQIDVVERPSGSAPVVREVGPFRLTFVPSAHSPIALGRVPFPGEIADCSDVPLRVSHYRCGAVFGVRIDVAGKSLFHLGSAELVDAQPGAERVDLLLCCTAGWTTSERFPERVVRAFSPRAVLLSHWDNFFRPLNEQARVLPAMQLPRLAERLSLASRDVRVGTLPLLGALRM